MSTFNENNGIYGYQQSKRKKVKDMLNGTIDLDVPKVEYDAPTDMDDRMSAGAAYINRSTQRWNDWTKSDREGALLNNQREALVPKDTEERRRRMFVTSPNVVDEALNSYYEDNFKPRLSAERKTADEQAFDDYKSYATVPGANPMTALGKMRTTADPIAALDRTMSKNDDEALDRIAEKYAAYAGLDAKDYRRTVLEPALRNKALNDFVNERTPRNTVEYIGRGAWRNSLVGGLTDLAVEGYSRNSNTRYLDDAAMENYNPSGASRFAANVGGLILDSAIFAGIGGGANKLVGLTTNAIKKRAVTSLMAKGATNGLTRQTAEQMVKNSMVNSLSAKIAQSSTTQGLTLGIYDAAHSVVNDLLHGQDVDASAAAGAFAKGAGTGALLGVVGTPLKELSYGLTGGKKLAASAGVLSAESAVFTASTQIEKAAQGIEIEPIDLLNDFGESAATLIAMRMLHWRPSGGERKLNTVGRLRPEYRLTLNESGELYRAGVNPEEFISNLEKSLNVYQKNSEKAQDSVRNDYLKLMSDSELSASTRAKLLYIVENKLSSTPPVPVDYKVEKINEDGYMFTTLDANGFPIKKIQCDGRESLRSAYFIQTADLRRNRIANAEKLLMQDYDSQNFFRQAGNYARETGVDVDVISDAMYRKANKEQLTEAEEQMMNDILQRSNYADSEVASMLHEMRRSLEQQYNLNEGSLLEAIDKDTFHCSPKENEALNAYEKAIENEVRMLYGGTSQERAHELRSSGGKYAGMGTDELKMQERNDYINNVINNGWGLNEGAIPTPTERYGIFSDGLRKPKNWNPKYVWNPHMYFHTAEDVRKMGNVARDLADKLGCKVDLIFDESEIKSNERGYEDKVRSQGWYDDVQDKVVINLPNNMNADEIRRTVVHEIVGHKGFAELFGNYYYDFLEEVYSRGSSEVRAGIESYSKRFGGSYHAAADEYLATLSERTYTTPEQRSIMRRFRDFVKDMLRRFNLYRGAISENELVSLIQRHHSAILAGKNTNSYRRGAFRPFETAWRTDGGYYDNVTARHRYDRYMRKNPELKGIAEGYHDFKRRIYDLPDENNASQYRYRYIGERGARNISSKNDYYLDKLNFAKKMVDNDFPMDMIAEKTGWEIDIDGNWRMAIPNDINKVEINDYLFRELNAVDPQKAIRYALIREKRPEERTDEEQKLLKTLQQEELPFDDFTTLDDIMYEPVFFSAYPELANVPVKFVEALDNPVLYHYWHRRLYVDKKVFDHPEKEKLFLAAVQHIVQDIEDLRLAPMNKKQDDLKFLEDEYYETANMVKEIRRMIALKKSKSAIESKRWDFKKKYGYEYYDMEKLYDSVDDYVAKELIKLSKKNPPEYRINIASDEESHYDNIQGPIDVLSRKWYKFTNEDKPEYRRNLKKRLLRNETTGIYDKNLETMNIKPWIYDRDNNQNNPRVKKYIFDGED